MFATSNEKYEKSKLSQPSYLRELTLEEGDVLLIYKKIDPQMEPCGSPRNEEDDNSLDLTGNPLEVDLSAGDASLNISSIDYEDTWLPEELSFGGLDRATILGSVNSELMRGEFNLNIYALCDGKNKKKIVLQGAKQTKTNFIRSQVFILDCCGMSEGNERMMYLQNEHLKEFSPSVDSQLKTSVLIKSTHNLYGSAKSLSLKSRCSASITCNVEWSSFHYDIPDWVDSINLTIKTVIGHEGSVLNQYFKELNHLKFLINLITKFNSDILSVTLNESSKPHAEILHDFGTIFSKSCPITKSEDNLNFENLRNNETYITDIVWNLFIQCETVEELQLTFQSLLEGFVSAIYRACPFHFSDLESSMIKKILSEISSKGKLGMPTLTPILSLKLLIDCGFEKLKRDYSCVLIRSNCLREYEIKQLWENSIKDMNSKDSKLTSRFAVMKLNTNSNIECNLDETFLPFVDALKKYQALMSMHVACDVLALSLKFSSLSSLNANIKHKLLKQEIKVTSNNPLFEIGCSLDKNFLKYIKEPTNLHIKFTSSIRKDTTETTFYHTSSKLFPPTLFDDYEPFEAPHYYVTKMVKYDTKLI
ncbi:protein zwilch [Onthophagus taurus]|uniref:protein zwilch n=1 Tax=Onthophagus taurus TaxID=166361 RepID=UPI0039BE5ADF